jgi:hypothetical protein
MRGHGHAHGPPDPPYLTLTSFITLEHKLEKLPCHGRIDCSRCFTGGAPVEFDVTKRTERDWRITVNPLAWGNQEPEIVVLGFSKGPTQAGALATVPHNDIAYKKGRKNVGKILHHIGLLTALPGEDLGQATSRLITDTAGRFHFGSLVRCTVERKDKDIWKGSGGDMLGKFIATPFGREVASNCAQEHLAILPPSVKLVVMFGMGKQLNYVGEMFKLFATVRKGPWRWINKVAYTDGEIVVVHVEHFASLGALIPQWMGVDGHPRGEYGALVRAAVQSAVAVVACNATVFAASIKQTATGCDQTNAVIKPAPARAIRKTQMPDKNEMVENDDIALIQAAIRQSGYTMGKNTKKLYEAISPAGRTLYLKKIPSRMNNIIFCADPGLDHEVLRKLDGVDSVDDQLTHHAAMSRFPKRKNNGVDEITYGRQVRIGQASTLARFLAAFDAEKF